MLSSDGITEPQGLSNSGINIGSITPIHYIKQIVRGQSILAWWIGGPKWDTRNQQWKKKQPI
ncbi:hypothetical protein Glove_89g102 [Diversispora epigaea]|uniref:Uncharacterized protein n=1 Tax=Diversispora epigaea TaxID=1348612 RepID=A0A397JA35_9GLOM|nr:hypothetical protein Glove_89g102 [Diversispora epigaea]